MLYKSSELTVDEIDESDINTFILEHMAEGVFIVQDIRIKYANNAIANLYGKPLQEIIGQNARIFVHPEERARLKEIFYRRMNDEFTRAVYEYRFIDKDDNVKWVLSDSITIIWDGKPASLQLLIDISARKRYEEELEKAYDIINQSSSVMFIWKGAEGWPVEYVTKNVEHIFGYTAEEFRHGDISYAELVHPDDIEHVAEEVASHSENPQAAKILHNPYRIRTKTGEIKWIEDKTVIRRDEHGAIVRYQGIVQDITERIEAENERERIISELQEALSHIKTLEGLIPICAYCKNIRNDQGYWNRIEEYLTEHSDAHFSHSICPSCIEKYHPDLKDQLDTCNHDTDTT